MRASTLQTVPRGNDKQAHQLLLDAKAGLLHASATLMSLLHKADMFNVVIANPSNDDSSDMCNKDILQTHLIGSLEAAFEWTPFKLLDLPLVWAPNILSYRSTDLKAAA